MQFLEKPWKMRENITVKPNYYTIVFLLEILLAVEMKAQILMNKSVYFGLLILEISKIDTHEAWYDYVNQYMERKAKLCYTGTDSFIVYINKSKCKRKCKCLRRHFKRYCNKI